MAKTKSIYSQSLLHRILLFLGLDSIYGLIKPQVHISKMFVYQNQVLFAVIGMILFILFVIFLLRNFQIQIGIHLLKMKSILALLLGCFLIILWAYVVVLFPKFFPSESANQQFVNSLTNYPFIYFYTVSIVAPIVEELLFRAIFFKLFFQKKTAWRSFALLLSSSLSFGMMHMLAGFDLSNLIVYTVGGLILGLVRIISKDIKVSILVHFFNNTFVNFFLGLLMGGH